MKSIKTLGLLAMAALVVAGLIGASTASAAQFTASEGGKSLKVTTIGKHVFTVTGNKVECNSIVFTGTTAGTSSPTQTVKPEYKECTAFGFANATVNTTGCSYTFNAGPTSSGHSTVNLSGCTAHNGGVTITVNVPFIAKCNVMVYNQEGINGIHYTDEGKGDIVVEATSTNIKSKVTESSGACPFTAGQTHENAEYKGSSTVEAEGGTVSYDA